MRIEDIIRITDGLLQNFPSVDQIESIKTDSDKIQRGDLFLDIDNSLENQKIAVENGAFAVLSEDISNISDEEIAWIEVDSLRLACVKLARYEFSKKNGKILFIDDISQEIIQKITKNLEFTKLFSNVSKTLIAIIASGENMKFTCSDERLAFSLDPYCHKIDCRYSLEVFDKKSPFYTSFICNDKFFHDIKIPNIFVNKLCSIITYLEGNNIEFNVQKLQLHRHFSPVFINHGLRKKEFGQGEKVIIFESNKENLDLEIGHLSNFSDNFIICIPKIYKNYFLHHKNIFLLSSNDEIEDLAKKEYRYILIFGKKDNYEKIFKMKKEDNRSLFNVISTK